MIPIPHKTLAQIDAALNAPNMKTLRDTLATAAKQMQPMIDAGTPDIRVQLDNAHRMNFGLRL